MIEMIAFLIPMTKSSASYFCSCAIAVLSLALIATNLPAQASSEIAVYPKSISLRGQTDRQRVIVSASKNGRPSDVTPVAAFECDPPNLVSISKDGVVVPVGNGQGTLTVTVAGQQTTAAIQVFDSEVLRPVDFERDVVPILTRTGCNAGACHGKARGQNGFQLSLLGFDAEFDYQAIVKEARGRRIFPAAVDQSLLLRKPIGQLAHGGGKKLDPHDANFDTLRRWIVQGAPRKAGAQVALERLTVEPSERILASQERQQVVVTAHYGDGSTRDVTHLATFLSNEKVIAAADADGLIQAGPVPGEAAVMARFMDKFAICNITIPLPGVVPAELYANLPRNNFIDGHVWNKLQRLGITPSESANDGTFVRRAYLDVIGRLPTPDETRTFLADASADKHGRLVDHLLNRPEYADYWANKWADLLRPNPYRVGIKAVYNLDAWLRESFRRNKPYDQFVRELVTAQGSTFRYGAATVFRDRREPEEITPIVSQLFLGIRLDCAKCHHHPFEIWSQEDFYQFAAYFAKIGRKGTGLSPPISGSEEIVFSGSRGEVKHPISGTVLSPKPLFGKTKAYDPEDDPRRALADWIVAPENPYFARVIVNRVWADLMGRGFVDPVDDLRATNPPSNEPLLAALADEFRREKYDLKQLIRTIMSSYVYGLSSTPTPRNVTDTRNYSRHYRQRFRAEVALDAVCDITQASESFAAAAPGTRAMELWTVRTQSVFLDSFGRPDPNQDPPCERTSDTTVVQALHLMNAPDLQRKVAAEGGRAATLAAKLAPPEIVDELYVLVYSRRPTDDEMKVCLRIFDERPDNKRAVTEDLLWALINTPEFIFKD